MIIEIGRDGLINHVNRQLTNIFGSCDDVAPYIDITLQRCEKCFKVNRNAYYYDDRGVLFFSPYHSGQYSIFLYYLSNTIYLNSNKRLASVVYYLNKVLHSVDWYYEIKLPEYWGVEHPVGSVLGKAQYGSGLFVYQGCTVGGNKGKYPVMGENIILYANSTIVGDTRLGNNVLVSTGTIIKDDTVPDNCIVFGQSPDLIIKSKDRDYLTSMISHFWLSEQE